MVTSYWSQNGQLRGFFAKVIRGFWAFSLFSKGKAHTRTHVHSTVTKRPHDRNTYWCHCSLCLQHSLLSSWHIHTLLTLPSEPAVVNTQLRPGGAASESCTNEPGSQNHYRWLNCCTSVSINPRTKSILFFSYKPTCELLGIKFWKFRSKHFS